MVLIKVDFSNLVKDAQQGRFIYDPRALFRAFIMAYTVFSI